MTMTEDQTNADADLEQSCSYVGWVWPRRLCVTRSRWVVSCCAWYRRELWYRREPWRRIHQLTHECVTAQRETRADLKDISVWFDELYWELAPSTGLMEWKCAEISVLMSLTTNKREPN